MSYIHFLTMVAVSTAIMFELMYLNVFSFDHVFFSQTRLFMALIMGSVMAVVMLCFMLHMYTNMAANLAIYAGAAILFAGSLYLVRSQETVGDVAWMKAMIPHHLIAILTSERATITDPRARKLADEIMDAQCREIDEMKGLITGLHKGG
ncbi:DUF305 domain-containing protein [Pseudorhizobium flavum]|uniref:Magnesium-transporting ATPase (P-type) n=1 Tax=Pseudorhizobium flavum TaxID=1335061 RepID=A0A7X0DBR1_9HYPH|nr:DUF305 domain-containing protein [Pseudorhizobium flavum]MBB6178161.1 magnesium-transporting ATPase (P-type) [Pseudorhizobium flavum]CAD6614518.1 hypothetical protein RFYW14_02695 [Pseudorhizobium flavum]